jgi:hypothetical protein
MPSGGPAPPPRLAPAPIPSGSGGGAGGHRRRDRIRLEYMLRKFLGLTDRMLEKGHRSTNNSIATMAKQPIIRTPEHRLDSFIGDATAYNASSNSGEDTIRLAQQIIKVLRSTGPRHH